jgi:hypothetical protein
MGIPNIRIINGKIVQGKDPFPPAPTAPRTDPSPQDRQFHPNPKVSRTSQGEFYVQDLVDQPMVKHTVHLITVECEYCHKTVQIHVHAPINAAKFILDEAWRLVKPEHLRTEHPATKKK